jgi:hypothetical protein
MRFVRHAEEGLNTTLALKIYNVHEISYQIGNISQHDAESSPRLPHHDKRATNGGRCTLGGVDGDSGRFGANAEAEEEAGDEEVGPGVGDTLPNAGGPGEKGGNEYSTTAAKVLVHRLRNPAADKSAAQLRDTCR